MISGLVIVFAPADHQGERLFLQFNDVEQLDLAGIRFGFERVVKSCFGGATE
jgi:hypothetical protein